MSPRQAPDGGGPSPRWPRRRRSLRTRHHPARWDPERTGEDLPSLGGTIGIVLVGAALLAMLAAWQGGLVLAVYGALLLWSIAVDVTGNRVTTRVRGPVAVVLWALLRPVYAVGIVVVGLLEAVLELVF